MFINVLQGQHAVEQRTRPEKLMTNFSAVYLYNSLSEDCRSTVCPAITLDVSKSVHMVTNVRLSKVFCQKVRWVLLPRYFK